MKLNCNATKMPFAVNQMQVSLNLIANLYEGVPDERTSQGG